VVSLSAKGIRISELSEYCDSLARRAMKDHEKRFTERAKSIREAAINLSNAAARFESAVRSAWGTLEKTTSEYGARLAHIIQENALAISKKETPSSYNDTERFHEQSVQTLNRIILSVRKYVPKLHRALRTEMATLNSSLAKLENSITALGAALDKSPGAKLETLRREVEQMTQRQAELIELRSQEQKESATLEGLSGQEGKIMQDKESLLGTSEFQELKRYEDAMKLKSDEIHQFLQPLAKPLLKLERMASMKQASVDAHLISNLIENPTETIVTSKTYAIMQLLNVLEEKLNQHSLEFEEKRRRKAQETISKVKDGTLDEMREEYLALQANIQETMRQLKSIGVLDKRDALEALLTDKRTQIEEASARKGELDRRIDDLMKTVLKHKSVIESQISAVSDRSISILTE